MTPHRSLRRASRSALVAALVLGMAAAPAMAAKLYKWTDENGVTHYTDSPPPEGKDFESRTIQQDGGQSTDVAAEQDEAAAPETARAGADPVSENCTRVRANLTALESAATVTMDLDGDGTPEQLTPEQRAQQLELARRQVQAFCGPAPGQPADEAPPQE